MIAVADVDEAAERFARFTGCASRPSPHGHTIPLARGRIDLRTPETFAAVLPESPIPSLPFIGAYGIAVASLDKLANILRQAGLPMRRFDQGVVTPFPAELGHGAWMFTESAPV
jgi:hypothetical protein